MAQPDHMTQACALAERAATILQERRNMVLEQWENRLRTRAQTMELADLFLAPDLSGGPDGAFAHLLKCLRNKRVGQDHHWIHPGRRRDVRLGQIHQALTQLKAAALAALTDAADRRETTVLCAQVDGAIDHMLAQEIESYDASHEAEAPAIRNRLQRMIRGSHMAEAEVIARIGESLLELPTLADLLQAVAEALQLFRHYRCVCLFRLGQDADRCVLVARAGPEADMHTGNRDIVKECAARGESVRAAPGDQGDALSRLAVPIKKAEKVIGVVELASAEPNAFDDAEVAALDGLSLHVGIALQSAEMLDEQRRYRRATEHAQRQLATIIRSTAVGITSMDSHGVYTHWSPRCEEMLGYTADEVVGQSRVADFCAEPGDVDQLLADSIRGGRTVQERVMVRKDGERRTIQETVVPMLTEEGKRIGFTSCLADVTEKRQAEAALLQERDKLNLVVAAMGAGLAMFDGRRRLQWANGTWLDCFGLDQSAFGHTCQELGILPQHDGHMCPVTEALKAGQPRTDVVERTDLSGQWHCYMRAVTPVAHGETRALLLMMDITDQKRQTEKFELVHRLTLTSQGSLDLDHVLHVVLTCATAGHAIGFNRAFLFLLDETGAGLEGAMAVGPASPEDAMRIWREISEQSRTLQDLVSPAQPASGDLTLTRKVQSFSIPLSDESSVLTQALRQRTAIVVRDAWRDERVGPGLAKGLELGEFVCVPLVARDDPLGVVLADNMFSGTPIDEEQVELLRTFSAQASLAIANAKAYRKISTQMREIEKAHKGLIEAERFAGVGRMATHLAHEIRNPLTAIGGFAQSIERSDAADEPVRRSAGIIYRESIRLENTLANVLELARPITPRRRMTDLNQLVTETIREFADEFRSNSVKLRLELEPDLPELLLDPDLIKQVVINLLKNAVQAVENVEDRQVLVATEVETGIVTLTVADSGSGMKQETMEAVFAPFFTTKVGGSGLGLAVSRRIISEHGGEIDVTSQLGRGSAFRVSLALQ